MTKVDKTLLSLIISDLIEQGVISFFKTNGDVEILYSSKKDTHRERHDNLKRAKKLFDNGFIVKEIDYKDYDLKIIPNTVFTKQLIKNNQKSFYRKDV